MRAKSKQVCLSHMSNDDILMLTYEQPNERIDQHNFWLTKNVAQQWIEKGALEMHEVMALLSGLNPITAGGGRAAGILDPKGQDIPAAARMLKDAEAQHVRFPMSSQEFADWCRPWHTQLPEALLEVLETRAPKNTAGIKQDKRVNSAAITLSDVCRCMSDAISKLGAANCEAQKSQLPGSKAPFCEYLKKHSDRLKKLSDATLHGYFDKAGYSWIQSGNRKEADTIIRRVLGLPNIKVEGRKGNRMIRGPGNLHPFDQHALGVSRP